MIVIVVITLVIVLLGDVHCYKSYSRYSSFNRLINSRSSSCRSSSSRTRCSSSSNSISINNNIYEDDNDISASEIIETKKRLDKEFVNLAIPAFLSQAAEPLIALVDAIYVGRLGAMDQAGMGIAISAQYSVAKLYNDPLLKTSTSLVAGKSGKELSTSVATAISTAMVIGLLQAVLFFFLAGPIMSFMGVSAVSDMRKPAVSYMKWRALGVPATTVLLVSNGIFRGRGDTKTPLYCTAIGNFINIILDPILIFGCNMGLAGAGVANAVCQWATALPLLYLLNKAIPFSIFTRQIKGPEAAAEAKIAFKTYFKAGGMILLRTIAKISAYTATSAAAARLGTLVMAAYSMTFNLGFTTSQICESISIAAQSLIARDMPLTTKRKKMIASHVVNRALLSGVLVSGTLTLSILLNQAGAMSQMTKSPEVRALAVSVMPIVLIAQILKGVSSSTVGILMGGLDWEWSTAGMATASMICVALVKWILPPSLASIWISLSFFMATQLIFGISRIYSNSGPWKGLNPKKSI